MPLSPSLPLLLLWIGGLAAAGQASAHSVRLVPREVATIQAAIDLSAAGDTVLVEPGIYRERIRFRGRPLTLLSRAGPALTIIDGGGGGPVVSFVAGEGRDSVIDGFTVRGGSHPLDAGGIHINGASPTVRHNIVRDNVGGRRGHGISVVSSVDALILDNVIRDNVSWPAGNGSGGGGGIGVEVSAAVEIRRNRIHDNQVSRFSSGGGINLVNAGATAIVGNRIEGNRARLAGAGIAIHGTSSARIENNLIVGNGLTEPGHGGGVHWLITVGPRGPHLIGNTIVSNHAELGAGIHADGDDSRARIINNLVIAPNGLAAIDCGDFNDLAPPLVRYNNAVGDAGAYVGTCAASATGDRNGNRSQQPTFVAGSWRLAPGSPGIDVGDNQAASEELDMDGHTRITDGDGNGVAVIDIGAFEAW